MPTVSSVSHAHLVASSACPCAPPSHRGSRAPCVEGEVGWIQCNCDERARLCCSYALVRARLHSFFYTHARTHTHLHWHKHNDTHTHSGTHTHTHPHTHTHTHTHTHSRKHTHTHVLAHRHTCMQSCTQPTTADKCTHARAGMLACSVCLSSCLSVCLSVSLPLPPVSLSHSPSPCLSLFLCLSVCLSVCLSPPLPLSQYEGPVPGKREG